MDSETRCAIENKLCQAARTKALYWTQAAYYFARHLKFKNNATKDEEFDVEKLYKSVLCKENLNITDLAWIHITQVRYSNTLLMKGIINISTLNQFLGI